MNGHAGGWQTSLRSAAHVNPTLAYLVVVVPLYAWVASYSLGTPLGIGLPNRDMWQHLAVLTVLIDNPVDPQNPFVDTGESSRSFGPFWVAIACLARWLGWTSMQAFGAAAMINLALLASAIYTFARAWLPNRWGPLALLAAMTLGWSAPMLHTGFHSGVTLIDGAALPAVTMIAGSLFSWTLAIRILEARHVPVLASMALGLLTALLMANHQLGAAITLIGVGCFATFSFRIAIERRALIVGIVASGLLLAALWPYHNPYAVFSEVGNTRWSATASFYDPLILLAMLTPAALGIWGLKARSQSGDAWPLLVALAVFVVLFIAGASPKFPAGHRFSMPAMLILHIGLAYVLLSICDADGVRRLPERARWIIVRLLAFTAPLHLVTTARLVAHDRIGVERSGELPVVLAVLLPEPPNSLGIAAAGVAAWPVVATGQKVLSVPWPEPLIHDLAARQKANDDLFDPALPRQQRLALAKRWKVDTLIIDSRHILPEAASQLRAEGWQTRCAGPMMRFDLRAAAPDQAAARGTPDCRLVESYFVDPPTAL